MNDNTNIVMLAIKNVQNTCIPVHQFPLIIAAPIPMKNVAKPITISAANAFQCIAKPIIQCTINPAPTPSIAAENATKRTAAVIVAVVWIPSAVCVSIIASARYERNIPHASIMMPNQIDVLIVRLSCTVFLKASMIDGNPYITRLLRSIWGWYGSDFA